MATNGRWRSLTHPLTVVMTIVLVLNDNLWKRAYGGIVTGKLSDIAGVFVFAIILGELASRAVTDRRRAGCIGFATAAVCLVAAKTSDVGAQLAEDLFSVLAGPSRVVADRTDLVALVALAPAWRVWSGAAARPVRRLATARVGGLAMAVVVTVGLAGSAESDDEVHQLESDGTTLTALAVDNGQPSCCTAFTSSDQGMTWEIEPSVRRDVPTVRVRPLIETCSDEACFRIVDGTSIQRRSSSGEWIEEYEIGEGRQRFIDEFHIAHGAPNVLRGAANMMVAVDGPGGASIVVGARDEGVVVRSPDGTWTRRAVGGVAPAPLSGDGDLLAHHAMIDLLVGSLILVLARRAILFRRARHRWAWTGLVAVGTLTAAWVAVGFALFLQYGVALVAAGVVGLVVVIDVVRALRRRDGSRPSLRCDRGWAVVATGTILAAGVRTLWGVGIIRSGTVSDLLIALVFAASVGALANVPRDTVATA